MDEFPVLQIPDDEVLEEEEFERLYSAPIEIVIILSIFYGGISILAIIGNSLVIWVVITARQMRTVTNTYIANLAVADVIIGLFCIPFQFQAALLQRWNLPWFMCAFCPFVQTLSVNVSVFTLTAIAIDRHRAIINPLRARPSKYISKFILLGIWLSAFIFASPIAVAFRVEVMHERYREDGVIYNVTRPFCTNVNLSDEQLKAYRYALVIVQYCVPCCVISFVYVQMAVKLWLTETPGNAEDTRDMALMRNKKKVIKMLIVVVIVFGICWLPLQLYNVLYVTIPEINEYHFISIIWFCCDWLAMSNSCYNPFIYGIYNEKFKREFNKRFNLCFCKFRTNNDAHERTLSMHTRATSLRSNFANSSMRIRNNLYAEAAAGQHKPDIYYTYRYANMRSSRNGSNASAHNNIAMPRKTMQTYDYSKTNTELHNAVAAAAANGQSVPQWRRNNFKPLYPDVIECEDDLDTLMHSTPTSEEPNSSSAGSNKVNMSAGPGFIFKTTGKR
ncbi:RYamide receptor [Bactrocera dorsalis]|uniref:RYamide receptor n=1 Tax=Bactrocera dorsalis TaxID=27457 RepID=A0A6I9V0L7_BACDO|nr:RYamide receptor [Bactrocera dorsalis]XP_049313843.1 RYamide receptor [Bactrocera dorsalis]XP_049313844.1 RYamide receptor [Bactrocera dorsalis]